ncbi:MAG: CHASE2 domain-containing protein [Hyphomicrobiaceae bacterium]
MTPLRNLISIAAAVLAAAIVLRAADPVPVAQLRAAVFDSYLRLAPRRVDPAMPVRIVAIDEGSLAALGQWPWPRAVLADLIGQLHEAGAKVIALDVVLAEPDRMSPDAIARAFAGQPGGDAMAALAARLPSGDRRLGEAIARAGAVLGFAADDAGGPLAPPRLAFASAGDDPRGFVPKFSGAVAPRDEIASGARGLGAVNWLPEHDQVVRRIPLLVQVGSTLQPALVVEALRVAAGESTVLVRSSGASGGSAFGQQTGIERLRIGRATIPTTAAGELWLRPAPHDDRRELPAHRVLAPDFDAREVAGRHVFIGATAVGLKDLRATALTDSVPGVEIHAQALEQLLAGDFVVRPAFAAGAEMLFLLVVGALVAGLIMWFGPLVAALATLGAMVVVGAASWLAFSHAGYLIDPVYPSLAVVVLYVTGSLGTYLRTELERARVRTAFRHYVAPAVVDELARHPEKLKLGGERRDVSLLFADVRNFSRIAEGLEAEALIGFVNRLFGPLSDVILEHRGTIDKYMGDAVMAFWNAPLAEADHARLTCRAALAMQERLAALNGQWHAEAAARGESHAAVHVGIGINTGPCAVGNVGTAERFDYSILGDAVNVAARLESTTKTYGVPIVCGRPTVEAVPDFAFLEIARTSLRGRTQAEEIFALIGDETFAARPDFQALRRAHEELRRAMEAREHARAAAALAECLNVAPPACRPLLAHHEQELAARREDRISTSG